MRTLFHLSVIIGISTALISCNGSSDASLSGATSPTEQVDPSPINGNPATTPSIEFASIDPASVNEAQTLNVDVRSTTSGGTATYSCESCPNFVSINSTTGQLTIAPGYSDSGHYGIRIIGIVATASSHVDFDLTVVNVNRAPVFTVQDKSIAENEPVSGLITPSDPDGDPIISWFEDLPSGASTGGNCNSTLGCASPAFSWTPGYNQSGVYTVKAVATDGTATTTKTFTITVSNVNRPPVFDAVADQSTTENGSLSFSVSASDSDGDSVVISILNAPANMTLSNGTVTFNPSCTQAGDYAVNFQANDGLDSVNKTVNVHVAHTNCYDPTWTAGASVSGYTLVGGIPTTNVATTSLTHRITKSIVADPQGTTGVQVGYAGVIADCYNNLTGVSIADAGAISSPAGHEYTVTTPANNNNYWVAYYGQDPDGVQIYLWKYISHRNDGIYTDIRLPVTNYTYLVGKTLTPTAEMSSSCAGVGQTVHVHNVALQ